MKYLTYLDGNNEKVGVLSEDGQFVYDLGLLGYPVSSMIYLIKNMTEEDHIKISQLISKDECEKASFDSIKIMAPIPHPQHDILCIGQNYVAHAIESARFKGIEYKKAENPVYFSKRVNRAVDPEGSISLHADITQKLDYEVELAVVIGRECSKVSASDVEDYIFGYTIVNDVSARDLQIRHSQYSFAKGLDNATPMGPYIVTKDEISYPPVLAIKSRVNGELCQNSSTDDFIFDINYIISQLSSGMTLYPGDIIITGTPSGVGMGFDPPKFLKANDVIECEIEGIGILRNYVKCL